jgi:hypothetical protein
MTTPTTSGGMAAERAAWTFYTIAALGSSIGQIWVGVTAPPWPASLPWWLRAALVLPFAVVIDLGGVVTSAFADWRQRLGEAAYGWRILSLSSVTVGVGINVLGHANIPYLAVVFGGLGCFAYAVWLLHASARRRDSLRAHGMLGNPAPVYGPAQWRREPEATRRAKTLALEHGYGLHESLAVARRQLADERSQAALAAHLTTLLAAQHDDSNLANILVAAIPGDRLAAEVAKLVDISGWARLIAADLQPTTTDNDTTGHDNRDGDSDPHDVVASSPELPAALLKEIPSRPDEYRRWQHIWTVIRDDTASTATLADRHGVSRRTLQRIRKAGELGLLDSPIPLIQRLLPQARKVASRANDHPPNTTTVTAAP